MITDKERHMMIEPNFFDRLQQKRKMYKIFTLNYENKC